MNRQTYKPYNNCYKQEDEPAFQACSRFLGPFYSTSAYVRRAETPLHIIPMCLLRFTGTAQIQNNMKSTKLRCFL